MNWSDFVKLKFLVIFSLFLVGCSTKEIKVETEKLNSNKVVYPAHMYSGVLVKPSWNWKMGHGAGVRLDEKLEIIEIRSGISTIGSMPQANGKNIRVDANEKREDDGEPVEAVGVCEERVKERSDRERIGEWNVHFKSDDKKSYDFEFVVGELSLLKPSLVSVAGYTDDIGDDIYNDNLSKQRAYSVSEQLKEFWGSAEFKIVWGGECPKVVLNTDGESRQRNRRVEIVAYK
jgi:hypothetical protein